MNFLQNLGSTLMADTPGGQTMLNQQAGDAFSGTNDPQQQIQALLRIGTPQAMQLAQQIYVTQNDPAKQASAARLAILKQYQDQQNGGQQDSALGTVGNTLNAANPGSIQGTLPGSQPVAMPDILQMGNNAVSALGSLGAPAPGMNMQQPSQAPITAMPQAPAPMQQPQALGNPDFTNQYKQAALLKEAGIDLTPSIDYQVKRQEDAQKKADELAKEQRTRENQLPAKVAEKDAEYIAASRDNAKAASSMLDTLQTYKDQLNTIPSMEMGPVAGRISPNIDPKAQELESTANTLALQAKTLMGFPNSNFSDADRDFLAKIAGGITLKKEAAKGVADKLGDLAKRVVDKGNALEDYYTKNNKVSGFEKEYSANKASSNPVPEATKQLGGKTYAKIGGKWFLQ